MGEPNRNRFESHPSRNNSVEPLINANFRLMKQGGNNPF